MQALGANKYAAVGVETGVAASDPHELVLMLYDGAIAATQQARAHMRARRVAEKGTAIGKAARIVDEGLKASLDRTAGGDLAQRLLDLYDYITMRLLQANLRNDEAALEEVVGLLNGLRVSWAQIGGASSGAAKAAAPKAAQPNVAPAAPVAAPAASTAAAPAAVKNRFSDGALSAPARRFVATSA